MCSWKTINCKFHTWIHCSGIIAGTIADEAPDALALIFGAPGAAAADAFHKSIPIFRLVAGIDTTGFPGTDAPAVLFCALAAANSTLL